MADTKNPKVGQNVIEYLVSNTKLSNQQLKSLSIKGDIGGTSVIHSQEGTTIHRKNVSLYPQIYKDYQIKDFYGVGLRVSPMKLSPGEDIEYSDEEINRLFGHLPPWQYPKTINVALIGDGEYIDVEPATGFIPCGYVPWKISYIGPTPSGGGSGGVSYKYTGEINAYNSGWIYVSEEPVTGDTYLISSTLRWIKQLNNDPIVSDTFPLSTQVTTTFCYPEHFMQLGDWIGNKGINTIVTSGGFRNTHTGAGSPDDWQYIFQYTGPQVDCLLTGGRFVKVNSHWQDSGGETPEEKEPDDHTINNLLSGDNQHIFIKELTGVSEINDDGSWGGIISTNIHGDEITIHMAEDGTLSAIGGGGGGTTIIDRFAIPDYYNLAERNGLDVNGPGYTWLFPVSAGANISYATEASGLVTAKYSPLEGIEGNTIDLTRDQLTPISANGHVRLTVFDDGNHKGQCVRFYYNTNNWTSAFPVYKFGSFGKEYEAGRYMQIQKTSSYINEQEQEQTYYLDEPIIHNMLTGGNHIWIQQTEIINGQEVELKYPRINCDLTGGSGIQITTGGVINNTYREVPTPIPGTILSASTTGMTWEPNTAGGGTTIIERFGVPDYYNLAERNGMNVNGIGNTWLFPVSSGASVSYATDAGELVTASYSPLEGKQGPSFNLTRDTLSTVPEDGYVRLTVFDDGNHKGSCVRLFYNTTSWASAFPVYKFGSFQNLTGDSDSHMYVNNGVISTSLHGDGTSVIIDNDGTIHATGGGAPIPTPGEITNGFLFTSGAYISSPNSEVTIMLPPVIGGNQPFIFENYNNEIGWVCSNQNPPSAVPVIESLLNITLSGDMHGYNCDIGQNTGGDFVVLLPETSGRCTVRIRGVAATNGHIVSNGKRIFKYSSEGLLESPLYEYFDDQEDTFEVMYYVDFLNIYSSFDNFNSKERLYIYIDASTVNDWSYNTNFFNNILSAINEDGGAWIRYQKTID